MIKCIKCEQELKGKMVWINPIAKTDITLEESVENGFDNYWFERATSK